MKKKKPSSFSLSDLSEEELLNAFEATLFFAGRESQSAGALRREITRRLISASFLTKPDVIRHKIELANSALNELRKRLRQALKQEREGVKA